MNKPLSLARRDYMNELCEATNRSKLPAFIVVDVLEKLLQEMHKAADNELKRDYERYNQSLQEVTDNGQAQ